MTEIDRATAGSTERRKQIRNCTYFTTLDNTALCELLHPANEPKELAIRFSIAHALVKPGETTRPHRLKTSAEVYYIVDDKGKMSIDDETATLHSGQAVYIPPGSKQHIQNTGDSDLKFVCIVYPMWCHEDEELV
ncbi:MAG: cupin domain-containing protein [Methanomicrobia archaeon]|nr:cupin domain-containing protein [Methanomicrobia archaeon]